jgi:hypothetical protein
LCGPGESGLGVNVALTVVLQVREELGKELLGTIQLIAERTAHG